MPFTYPVFFLPGIMGTRLHFPDSGRYWDPDDTIRMLDWILSSNDRNRRRMHGRVPAEIVQRPGSSHIDSDQERRGFGQVVWSYYESFLQSLDVATARTIHAIGYDWRQDISALGADTLDRIDTIRQSLGAEKIILITHSMGGLVVRAGLRAKPDYNERIAKTIHICQPSAGAVLMYRRMFTGLPRRYDSGWGFRNILGTDRSSFLGNVSGLPGAVQLLPSKHFPVGAAGNTWHPDLAAAADTTALYRKAASPPGLVPAGLGLSTEVMTDLRERRDDVAAFHDFLGAADAVTVDPSKTWLIYGTKRPTEVAVERVGNEIHPIPQDDGDETVPQASATALNLPVSQMSEVPFLEHGDACKNIYVQALCKGLLA